jgi:glycosyltransferase involved in cell wall biosynthesis
MENKEVYFSILCPTFNRASLLRRAIESVLKQEFKDFELIIINDGSSDNTREVVRSFNDNHIVYIEYDKNKGINAARNTGFATAKGSYIALLDDDDELAPYALQLAFDTFKRVNQKILFFNCLDVEERHISGKFLPESRIITYTDLLCQKLKGDYWIIVDRNLFYHEKVFDENSGGAGYTWLRLLQSNNAYYSPKVAYFAYRNHGFQRITTYRSWEKREFNAEKVLTEFGNDMKLYCPNAYSKQAAILAIYQMLNKKTKKARVNLLCSLANKPSIYAIVLILFTFLGKHGMQIFYIRFKGYFERAHF